MDKFLMVINVVILIVIIIITLNIIVLQEGGQLTVDLVDVIIILITLISLDTIIIILIIIGITIMNTFILTFKESVMRVGSLELL